MTESIGPPSPHPPSHTPLSPVDVPSLIKQMQTQVLTFIENLQKILEDPSLSEHPSFLQSIAQEGARLHSIVEQALKLR